MNETLLVTGAEGMVGSYAQTGIKLGREALDVTDYTAVMAAFETYHPESVIHLAAVTDQKACEEDPGHAYLVNAIGAYHVALAARTVGARMVYVSTNAVFDGKGGKPFETTGLPDPRSVYGRSKYAGECLVQGVLPQALVVRTSWVFGGGPAKDKKFVGSVMRQLQSGATEVRATSDVQGTPTYGRDFMSALLALLADKKEGLMHLTNQGICSRYDMALLLKEGAYSSTLVTPVPASTFGPGAPLQEALSGMTLRPWQEALREYIQAEWVG